MYKYLKEFISSKGVWIAKKIQELVNKVFRGDIKFQKEKII